jgi:hypothetical protein
MKEKLIELFRKIGNETDTFNAFITSDEFENLADEVVKLCTMPFVSGSFYVRGVTNKMAETREFVIKYINTFGKPPTYKIIAETFNIKRTAAYSRTKHFRELMVRRK